MVSHFAASEGHASPMKERCRITFPFTAGCKNTALQPHPRTKNPMDSIHRIHAHTPHVRGGSISRRGLTQRTRNRPHLQAEPSKQKGKPQTPAALRERGSGGEALLSEKRPLPQPSFPHVFSGGSAREGTFLQKRPLPRNSHSPNSSHMRVNSLREMAQTRFWSLLEQPLEIMTKTKRLSGSK